MFILKKYFVRDPEHIVHSTSNFSPFSFNKKGIVSGNNLSLWNVFHLQNSLPVSSYSNALFSYEHVTHSTKLVFFLF